LVPLRDYLTNHPSMQVAMGKAFFGGEIFTHAIST
jgi:hypothetical protein